MEKKVIRTFKMSRNSMFHLFIGICLVALFASFSFRRVLRIKGNEDYSLTTTCGSLTMNGFWSKNLFITHEFKGSFTLYPDSFNIEFIPETINAEFIGFFLDKKDISLDKIIYIQDTTVLLSIGAYPQKLLRKGTAEVIIPPCNYIMCGDKPLITDTIKITLR